MTARATTVSGLQCIFVQGAIPCPGKSSFIGEHMENTLSNWREETFTALETLEDLMEEIDELGGTELSAYNALETLKDYFKRVLE